MISDNENDNVFVLTWLTSVLLLLLLLLLLLVISGPMAPMSPSDGRAPPVPVSSWCFLSWQLILAQPLMLISQSQQLGVISQSRHVSCKPPQVCW